MRNFEELQIYGDYLQSQNENSAQLIYSLFEREIFPDLPPIWQEVFTTVRDYGTGSGVYDFGNLNDGRGFGYDNYYFQNYSHGSSLSLGFGESQCYWKFEKGAISGCGEGIFRKYSESSIFDPYQDWLQIFGYSVGYGLFLITNSISPLVYNFNACQRIVLPR